MYVAVKYENAVWYIRHDPNKPWREMTYAELSTYAVIWFNQVRDLRTQLIPYEVTK